MPSIKFTAIFGAEQRPAEINMDEQSGSHWVLTIGRREYDGIYERSGGYWYHEDDFEMEDMQALVDRITDYKGKPFSQVVYSRWLTHEEYWAQFDKYKKR